MKNILTVLFTAIVLTTMLYLYQVSVLPAEQVSAKIPLEEPDSPDAPRSPKYTIRILDGFLAVYQADSQQLLEQTPIDIRTLRQQDQQLLASGVPIYSDVELTRFLEDFGS